MVKGNGIPPAASATGAIGAVTSACATASTVEFTVEYITKMTTIAAAALTDTATMTAAAMTTGRITTTLTACVHRAISTTETTNQSATTAIVPKTAGHRAHSEAAATALLRTVRAAPAPQ